MRILKRCLTTLLLFIMLFALAPSAPADARGLTVTNRGIRYEKADGTYVRRAWQKHRGKYYYFKSNGYAARSRWVGNYYVDKNGRRLTGTWVGSRFVDARGRKVTSKSLKLSAPSAILIDADNGKIIYQKNANRKRANASTTKIMTAMLAIENGKGSEVVTFSDYAASQEPVKLYAGTGARFYLKDMMYALMLPSYNDVAVAVAEHIGGSEAKFVRMMNRKAKEIGCTRTTFVTPSGLDRGKHGTTAADMAKITRYALKNSAFRRIIKRKSYGFKSLSGGKSYRVTSSNQYLGNMRGMLGGKTGFTSKAGHCFIGAVKRGSKTYISVVLGAPNSQARWSDTRKLLQFGFKNYK